jgi:hypothetical protein
LKPETETVDIEIDLLDTVTLRRVEAYVNDCKEYNQNMNNSTPSDSILVTLTFSSIVP